MVIIITPNSLGVNLKVLAKTITTPGYTSSNMLNSIGSFDPNVPHSADMYKTISSVAAMQSSSRAANRALDLVNAAAPQLRDLDHIPSIIKFFVSLMHMITLAIEHHVIPPPITHLLSPAVRKLIGIIQPTRNPATLAESEHINQDMFTLIMKYLDVTQPSHLYSRDIIRELFPDPMPVTNPAHTKHFIQRALYIGYHLALHRDVNGVPRLALSLKTWIYAIATTLPNNLSLYNYLMFFNSTRG
jgi:hypothetical protein